MPHDRDADFLTDILDACRLSHAFLIGQSADDALRDDLRRSALLFQLIVIGEASGKVSLPLRIAHPEVPWKQLKGLRNVIVHQHWGLRHGDLVATVTVDLPEVEAAIRAFWRG